MGYLDENRSGLGRRWPHAGDQSRPALVWWRPSLREMVRHSAFRWVLLTPTIGLAALAFTSVLSFRWHFPIWAFGFKVLLLTLAAPALTWQYFRERTIRQRQDPFCVHCGWTLIGLPEEGRCPECGRPYRLKVVQMFRHDPQWVKAYWRLSGRPPSAEVFNANHRRGARF